MMLLWCHYCQFWKDSTPFLSISFLNFGNYCQLGLLTEIKVQTRKNYKTCKERCKLCNINQTGQTARWKKPASNLLNMQSPGFKQTCMKFIDSSDAWCLELYIINTFMKSTKAEKCTGIIHSSWHFIVYLLLLKIKTYNNDRYVDIF